MALKEYFVSFDQGDSDSSKDESLSDMQENDSGFGGYSRFGQFGSQLFQKTFGMVLGARPDRQVINDFYFYSEQNSTSSNGPSTSVVLVL